ncbi:MAG: hypothetical protein VX642_06755 [Bdellovibrionota bacterium]|nr:hypothetical protein [Bdellovibrionota bacterium]
MYSEAVSTFINTVESCEIETQRKEHFILFLAQAFPSHATYLRELASGAEKFVKIEKPVEGESQRGFIDSFYGNLVIEFEHGLPEMLEVAKVQLQGYIAKLWSKPGENTPYLCIATDGVRWKCYAPSLTDEISNYPLRADDIKLFETEEVDFSEIPGDQVIEWLDRMFFRENQLPPNPRAICAEFGSESHTFLTAKPILLRFFQRAREIPAVRVAFESWQKYLKYSYGTIDGSEELFVRHTYLSVVTKLLIGMILSAEKGVPVSSGDLRSIVEGNFFQKFNLKNYAEKDFFYWITSHEFREYLEQLWFAIFNSLKTFDFELIQSDFLKDIYQDLVDPDDRHDLGEYYTPDWLCERIAEESLEGKDSLPRMADITCGSGSFLRAYIEGAKKFCRSKGTSEVDCLNAILDSVYGFEIHPLAVFVAKTNYLLSLGEIRSKATGPIIIPVYLCDSLLTYDLKDSELFSFGGMSIKTGSGNSDLRIPRDLDAQSFDIIIDYISDLASVKSLKSKLDSVKSKTSGFLEKLEIPNDIMEETTVSVLDLAVELHDSLDDIDLDIWRYTVKNTYRPLVAKNGFDLVLGNPPWLAFRYVGSKTYKKELEYLGLEKYNVAPGSGTLRTQMELGTIFLAHACDHFLANDGKLYFVLPRSVFSADHHDKLRRRVYSSNFEIVNVWNLEEVMPLFRVPSCVLICANGAEKVEGTGFQGRTFSGRLPYQNVHLKDAKEHIVEKETYFHLARMGGRTALSEVPISISTSAEYYKSKFKQGADLMPRSFYFVKQENPENRITYAETTESVIKLAKKPYRDIKMTGQINTDFVFNTAIAENVVPFAVVDLPSLTLPVKEVDGDWKVVLPDQMVMDGFPESSNWFSEVDSQYSSIKNEAEGKVFEMLNYHNKLLAQNPREKYWVLYCTSGTNVCSAVYVNKGLFWADQTTYWCCTDNEDEAYYLSGVLNATSVDKIIKPFQSKGLIGERHVHKKVLDVGIPQYNGQGKSKEIADLARAMSEEVTKGYSEFRSIKSLGRRRSSIREQFKERFSTLDRKVQELFLDTSL